ncbi:hypothetical protein [Xanthomonas euvesicatoria]|uniref:hypothetical protein n=1 Tax=Xanthomonas euvesicatoria TaxID=456327 RepID=UPI001C448A86|nr:hypothetical protein [Xanthomonas euvesicatoria]MBV6850507.1 hypothetical protein [Xanthomonas campestris pv. heliotropii]
MSDASWLGRRFRTFNINDDCNRGSMKLNPHQLALGTGHPRPGRVGTLKRNTAQSGLSS